ncbi:2-amino-4-hydroxy-6-hydroxymethyldihydropteridine diphosphokinase [Sphingobacterium athyrii]|uniref:2-amino-4-hydroxy-6-hydroxymethyldihydropteridine pyrophosphokinase n=1 Tax=Sphingobacterium athyrii TaxID=2152717 RepID=A0A363NV86_9SPHI|nr:2-amino-4-hydroxy-6-hydroxymethyldihydropteridine diphosphokinase [Sphingobacterium athyrii]PUV24650.1 2-amino-4-hydroxy-6-hydroxymethyldihydropteridine diphosphokinase [Sphingobacterium athyrii]
MNKIFILLGTNLGDRLRQLLRAKQALEKQVGEILMASSIYETAAWGVEDQPAFLNQVILIKSGLSPMDCLNRTQQIESDLGRVRLKKWGQRAIDIDLLYFNDEIVNYPNLIIPHPFISERRFTLAPLAEIAPDYIHPVYKKNNVYLLHNCKDELPVKKISNDEPYRH